VRKINGDIDRIPRYWNLRGFLIRYIIPGLVFFFYLIGYLIIFDFWGTIIGFVKGVSAAFAVLGFLILFSVGELIRVIAIDHWPPVYWHIKKNFFNKIHSHLKEKDIASKLGIAEEDLDKCLFERNRVSKLLAGFNNWFCRLIRIINEDDIRRDVENKKLKYLWLYVQSDHIKSNIVRYNQSAYIFWFNIATIILAFLVISIITAILRKSFFDIGFLVLVGVSIFSLFLLSYKIKEGLMRYVSSSILAITELKDKLPSRSR
jgi:hypothetical protein